MKKIHYICLHTHIPKHTTTDSDIHSMHKLCMLKQSCTDSIERPSASLQIFSMYSYYDTPLEYTNCESRGVGGVVQALSKTNPTTVKSRLKLLNATFRLQTANRDIP